MQRPIPRVTACTRVSAGPWLLAAILLSALPASDALATDGLEPIGLSMMARARGGADVAVGDSALSQVDNPATLALSHADRFDFSGELLMPQIHWTSPVGDSSSRSCHPLADMAAALPINDRLTLGLAVHAKAGMGSHFDMRNFLIPFMERHVASDLKDMSFSLGAGYKLTDKLSVGASIRTEVATARFNSVLGPADVDFGRGYAYGGGFDFGIHYQATSRLAFGLAYRSPSWFGDLAGGDLSASLFGLPAISLGPGNMADFRLPQRISGGAAWDVTDKLKLIEEIRWTNYAESTFNDCHVMIHHPVDLAVPLPLAYRDQWTFITGAEYKLSDHWTAAAGYNYATPAVPRANLFPICAALIQHHLTTGLRYHRDNWGVGGGYILGFPASQEGNGRTNIPLGIDFAFSRVEQMQHSIFFGFGFTWDKPRHPRATNPS